MNSNNIVNQPYVTYNGNNFYFKNLSSNVKIINNNNNSFKIVYSNKKPIDLLFTIEQSKIYGDDLSLKKTKIITDFSSLSKYQKTFLYNEESEIIKEKNNNTLVIYDVKINEIPKCTFYLFVDDYCLRLILNCNLKMKELISKILLSCNRNPATNENELYLDITDEELIEAFEEKSVNNVDKMVDDILKNGYDPNKDYVKEYSLLTKEKLNEENDSSSQSEEYDDDLWEMFETRDKNNEDKMVDDILKNGYDSNKDYFKEYDISDDYYNEKYGFTEEELNKKYGFSNDIGHESEEFKQPYLESNSKIDKKKFNFYFKIPSPNVEVKQINNYMFNMKYFDKEIKLIFVVDNDERFQENIDIKKCHIFKTLSKRKDYYKDLYHYDDSEVIKEDKQSGNTLIIYDVMFNGKKQHSFFLYANEFCIETAKECNLKMKEIISKILLSCSRYPACSKNELYLNISNEDLDLAFETNGKMDENDKIIDDNNLNDNNLNDNDSKKEKITTESILNKIDKKLEEIKINNDTKDNFINLEDNKVAELEYDYMAELNKMVGLENVKKQVQKLAHFWKFQKTVNNEVYIEKQYMNMCFTGNPGTGKTTIARIIGKILYELRFIKKDIFIEITPNDLTGEYMGQTKVRTKKILDKAKDGLLFIDEAYLFASDRRGDGAVSYFKEALVELLKYMEDPEHIIIFAGYSEEMQQFIDMNSGIKSRITNYLQFDDYSVDDLVEILKRKMKKQQLVIEENAIEKVRIILEKEVKEKNFGNARYINVLNTQILMKHAENYYNGINSELKIIKKEDVDIDDSINNKIKRDNSFGFKVQKGDD